MFDKKFLPDFQSEAEEAQWFYDHRHELQDYMQIKPKNPIPLHERLGLAPKKPSTKHVALRLSVDDLQRAQRLAERKGIGYQTLLKMLIHEALEQAEKAG